MDVQVPFGPVETGQQTGFANPELDNGFVQQFQTSDTGIGKFGPPDDVFMAVIDSYFTYCQNQPYSFFHEDNFRERLSKQDVPRHLVLAMMAAAVRFCSHTYYTGRALEMSVEYANKSWKLIVSDCFTVGKEAEVSAVQTVALLGLFDFTGTWNLWAKSRVSYIVAVSDWTWLFVKLDDRVIVQPGSKLGWRSGWPRIVD